MEACLLEATPLFDIHDHRDLLTRQKGNIGDEKTPLLPQCPVVFSNHLCLPLFQWPRHWTEKRLQVLRASVGKLEKLVAEVNLLACSQISLARRTQGLLGR